MADVRESVAESTEMESIRIELELDKQSTALGAGVLRFNRVDSQRDSGLPDIDQTAAELPPVGANGQACASSPSNMASTSHPSVKSAITSPSTGFSTTAIHAMHPAYVATRRLSFNSLDSGMVEESADLSV